jgi:hypothetical protein
MQNNIACAYQDSLDMKELLGNIVSFPINDDKLHHLVIIEDQPFDKTNGDSLSYSYPKLFGGLPECGNWIIFSSIKTNQISRNVISFWQKLLRAIDLLYLLSTSLDATGPDKLFYLITTNLKDLTQVNNSSLWKSGPGLALHLGEKENPNLLKEAIHCQLNVRNSLIKFIKTVFKCAITPRHDGDGVHVIWAANWEYSEVMKSWALELVRDYPFTEDWNPF